jgi:hypothetical protein
MHDASVSLPHLTAHAEQKLQVMRQWLASFSLRRKVTIAVVFAIGVGVASKLAAALATVPSCV